MMCYSLFTLLDLIHEAEKNVIEMVGYSEYGKRLWRIGLSKQLDNLNWNDLAKIATATAQQRLEAMLICLGVEDLEGDK